MINNEEKINILIDRIKTIEFIIESYINHAKEFQNKYSLEEILPDYNATRLALIQKLESLGGSLNKP